MVMKTFKKAQNHIATCYNLFLVFKKLRTKLSINGAADLITDEGGDCLFLASRAHNTFTAFREMLFDCNPKFVAVV